MKSILEIKEGQPALYNIQLNMNEVSAIHGAVLLRVLGDNAIGAMLSTLLLMQADSSELNKMCNDMRKQYANRDQSLLAPSIDFVEQICLMRIQHTQQRPDDFNKKPTNANS